MRRVTFAQRRRRVGAFSASDLLSVIASVGLLAVLMLAAVAQSRLSTKRTVCNANLRGIGQGLKIYANDNQDWYPHHYYETKPVLDKQPPEHGVRWVGTMGSNDYLRITEATSKTKSPMRNHPSRSLFLLVTDGFATTKQFICPSSSDREDDLRNRKGQQFYASQPGINRFDFRAYNSLSYGYQLPYGPKARPHENLDARVAIMADKGPYYEAGEKGLAETVHDRRSTSQPAQSGSDLSAESLLRKPDDEWRPYNSRNHGNVGQNVLFQDGHVEFLKRPIVGVNYDNIYTIQSAFDMLGNMIGLVPGEDQAVGPLTETDSFIVP